MLIFYNNINKNCIFHIRCAICIVIFIYISLFFFTSCSCKKTVTAELPVTLLIQKVGAGSVTASWSGGSATDEELARGIQVMPNTEIKLQATTDSANVLWAYANSIGNGKMLPLLMQQNTTVNVAFYNLSFVNRVTIKKVHGVGMVQGSWHGGSSTDAELTKELTVPKGTRLKITGISNSPKVVWNNDMQHPSDTVSFFVLKDTVIEVGFYDPVVMVRKVHGTGTVSASWDAGAGTATDAELAGEVVLPKGTKLTISGASASPKVVWNGNMQHPSKDISFSVEKDTVIRVGFYDPIVKIEKIGGVGTVSGSWSNGKATDIELTRGIELPAGTQINFTPTTKYYHTAWTYGKDATKADTVNTSSLTITQDTTIKVNFFNIVYVAGYFKNAAGGQSAALWKDGKLQILSAEMEQVYVKDMYVTDDGDIYVVGLVVVGKPGWEPFISKNGKRETLSYSSVVSEVSSVYVSGSDVYMAGVNDNVFNEVPALWKNGQMQTLKNANKADFMSIYVSGSKVYVAGCLRNDTYASYGIAERGQAVLWIDGEPQYLYKRTNDYSTLANNVVVSRAGNDVYVAGHINDTPTLWKNGIVQNLEAANDGSAYQVFLGNNKVYVAGRNTNRIDGSGFVQGATLWVDGKVAFAAKQASRAESLYVFDNEVYMAGTFDNQAVLWINGVMQYLNTNGSASSSAVRVILK